MTTTPQRAKRVIVSGYFNPLHGGHLDMLEAAMSMGDHLLVIVNSDAQQLVKKGKIILPVENRVRLMRALRAVDEVVISIDEDQTQRRTLASIAERYAGDELIFANGGDRDSIKAIPEGDIAEQYGIKLVFGVGGNTKADSSTRINKDTGNE